MLNQSFQIDGIEVREGCRPYILSEISVVMEMILLIQKNKLKNIQ